LKNEEREEEVGSSSYAFGKLVKILVLENYNRNENTFIIAFSDQKI